MPGSKPLDQVDPRGGGGFAKPRKVNGLDPRRLAFISIYLTDTQLTIDEVAKRAGFGPNATRETLVGRARNILREPQVVYEIARRRELAARRSGLTLERHLDELARVGYSDMADFLPVLEADDPVAAMRALPADSTAAVKRVNYTELPNGARRIEISLWDKNDALKALASHLGMRRPPTFYGPGAGGEGAGGALDGERQATMRSMLRCLSPKQIAAWRDIVETIKAAQRQQPLLEDQSDTPDAASDNPDEEVSDE